MGVSSSPSDGRRQRGRQHSSGGWKLRLQSVALGLRGWARFLWSSSRPRAPASREYAALYFLSNAAAGGDRDRWLLAASHRRAKLRYACSFRVNQNKINQ